MHLQGKPSSLRSCQRTQCISANSSGKGGMWICSASRAVSTRDSERQSLTLTAPCANTGNGGTRLPRYVHCFLDAGVQGLWAQSQLERGNGARHRIKEARENGCLPWHSHAPAMKLHNSKARMGWSSLKGAMKWPSRSLAGAKKIKSSQSTEEPPRVACWPLQDKDGAIAVWVHQLLLSLEASGKTHGKQRLLQTSPAAGVWPWRCKEVWGGASWPGHPA